MPDLRSLHVSLTVEFDNAFHIGTGRAEGLVNRTVKRTADGRPYVPGSALKGALRESAERLLRRLDERAATLGASPERFLGNRRRASQVLDARCEAPKPQTMCQSEEPCITCRVFGNPLTGRRLTVDDARPVQPKTETASESGDMVHRRAGGEIEAYTQVRIDRRRKAAKGQALFASENARPKRLRSRLSGQIPLSPIEGHPPAELILLAASIAATDQIGAGASAGRGQCHIHVEDKVHIRDGESTRSYKPSSLVKSLEPLADSLLFS